MWSSSKTFLLFFSLAVFFNPFSIEASGVKKLHKRSSAHRRFIVHYKNKKTFGANGFRQANKTHIKTFKKGYEDHELKDLEAEMKLIDPNIESIEIDILMTAQFEPGDGGTKSFRIIHVHQMP